MKNTEMEGQLHFFDDFELLLSGVTTQQKESKKKSDLSEKVASVKANAESYLRKGERIVDLAKEHFRKELGEIELSDIEQKIFLAKKLPEAKEDYAAQIRAITLSVVRPILRRVNAEDDEYVSALLALIDPTLDVSIRVVPEGEEMFLYYLPRSARKKSSNVRELVLTVNEPGCDPLIVRGARDYTPPKNRRNCTFKSGSLLEGQTTGDIAEVLSNLIIFSMLRAEYRRVTSLNEQEKQTDAVFQSFRQTARAFEEQVLKDLLYQVPDEVDREIKYRLMLAGETAEQRLETIARLPLAVRNDMVPVPAIHDRLIRYGSDWMTNYDYRLSLDMEDFKAFRERHVMMSRSIEQELLAAYFMELFSEIRFHDLLPKNDRSGAYYPNPSYWNQLCSLMGKLFGSLVDQNAERAKEVLYLKQLNSDYAKSYVQKKNIPSKVLAAMEESLFNRYFGFVEFDEDCDLERTASIAEEFSAFAETYCPGLYVKEYAIRFRRLGNHKAAGLYYPSVRCLCVDIHNPSSLIHEFGHLLDHHFGRLSHQWQFREIKNRYSHLLRQIAENNPASALNSSTKYGISYYLEPTEIFARSFEIYCAKHLGVNNSLLKEDYTSEPYPILDTEYMDLVRDYFDQFFQMYFPSEEAMAA